MIRTESVEIKPLLMVFPFGLMSHYLRCLQLAKYFRPYFRVLFVYDEKYAGFLAENGFCTFNCRSLDAAAVLEGVSRFDFSWLNESDLEAVYLDQVRAINSLKPAAVLGDTSVTLKMAAEKTGVVFISLMNAYMSKYYARTRQIARKHPMYRIIKSLPHALAEVLTQRGENLAFSHIHGVFRKLRRRHQLSSKKIYLDELEGDINLICDLDELFPLKALPGNYRQIAPLFYNVDEAVTPVRESGTTKKTIFVSMGSSGSWEKVRFLNHPLFARYHVVTAGDTKKVLQAPHITAVSFINIHTLFPHTDLVICHGGNGTLYQALLYGIPVLCNTSHFEQQWNVDAMQQLHLGCSLNDEARTVEGYLNLVKEWMEKKEQGRLPSYRKQITAQVQVLKEVVSSLAAEIREPQVLRSGLRA